MTTKKLSKRKTPAKPKKIKGVDLLRSKIKQLTLELEFCRRLSEEAADAICTVDLSGKITYANQAQLKLLKISRKKFYGSHFRNYLPEDSLQKGYALFRSAKSGKEIRDELNILDSKGKSIPVEIHSRPMKKNKKMFGIHTIVRDIRKRREFEKLHREAEKMEALGHFVSGTAQEIKYPLEGIQRRLQKLLHNYENRDFEYIGYKEFKNIMRTIDQVAQQARYCFDTTNRLINMQKKSAGTLTSVCDANQVIKFSCKLLDTHLMHEGIRIRLRLNKSLPPVAMNETEFSQITVNLLTNAVQSMPNGGVVSVSTRFEKKRKLMRLVIKDEGVGIKKEHLRHIFEPFFTTKHRGLEKSSGLGLSIVYSIVQNHNGDISVQSNLRHGTAVNISLPVAN